MGLWDDIKNKASDVAGAVVDEAKKVENAVVDEAKKVENAVVDEVKKVEQKVEGAEDWAKKKAKDAEDWAKKKAKGAEDWAKKKAKQAEQAVKDEAEKIEKGVKDEANKIAGEVKQAEQKLVSSLKSGIVHIHPPSDGGPGTSDSILGLFDGDDKDKNLPLPPPLRISYFTATLPNGDPAIKVPAKAPVTLGYSLILPQEEVLFHVGLQQVTPGFIFDSHDMLIDGGTQPKSTVQVTMEQKVQFKLAAWIADIRYQKGDGHGLGSDERTIEVDVDEGQEWETFMENKGEFAFGGHLEKTIPADVVEAKLALEAHLVFGAGFDLKRPKEQVEKEIIDALWKHEHKPGGHLDANFFKLDGTGGEKGWKINNSVSHKEGETEYALGFSYELCLGGGFKLELEADAVKITIKDNELEPPAVLEIGAKGSWTLQLAELKAEVGEDCDWMRGEASAKAEITVEAGATLQPNWKALATDLGVGVIIDLSFIAGGIACIALYVHTILAVGELEELKGRIIGFFNGFTAGYVAGLAANKLFSAPQKTGDTDSYDKGYEKGKQEGMSRRAQAIQKAMQSSGRDEATVTAHYEDWIAPQLSDVYQKLLPQAEAKTRQATWDDYGKDHMDTFVNRHNAELRHGAFSRIFDNPPQGDQRWAKYVNEYTPDMWKVWGEQ
jgi:hypothetical protein